MEGQLVRAGSASEDRRPERLQGGPVLGDKVEVVREERGDAEREHGAHEEQEQDVEPATRKNFHYDDRKQAESLSQVKITGQQL